MNVAFFALVPNHTANLLSLLFWKPFVYRFPKRLCRFDFNSLPFKYSGSEYRKKRYSLMPILYVLN